MMKQLWALSLLVVIIGACSGIQTTADYDTSVNFQEFKTYEFYGWDKNTTEDLNSLDRKRIETAFAEEFTKRGLERVEKGSGGDLVVSLYLVNEQRKETSTATTFNPNVSIYLGYGGYYGFGPGWGYGPGWGGSATTYVSENNYRVGTLICSVFDAKKQQLVWESAASKTIDENPELRKKSIPYVVKAIMRKFPKK